MCWCIVSAFYCFKMMFIWNIQPRRRQFKKSSRRTISFMMFLWLWKRTLPFATSLAETQWLSSGYGHLQWLEQYFGWLHKRSSCRSPLGRILASLQSNLSRVWTFPPCGSLQLQALHTSILAWRRGGYLQKGRCLSDVLSITFGVRYFKTPHADVAELRKSWRLRIST